MAHPPLDAGLALAFDPATHPPLDPGDCPGFPPPTAASGGNARAGDVSGQLEAVTAAAAAAAAAAAGPAAFMAPLSGSGSSSNSSAGAMEVCPLDTPCPHHFAPFLLHYAHYAAFAADGSWQGFLPPGQRGDWHFAKADMRDAYPPHPFPRPPGTCSPRCEGVVEVLDWVDAAARALWAGEAGPAAARAAGM